MTHFLPQRHPPSASKPAPINQSKTNISTSSVKKYYSPTLKAWLGDLGDGTHDGGPEDPRIGVIKVTAKTITYAIVKNTAVGRGVEMLKGVVTGSAASVNKLRELSAEEVSTWRSSQEMVQ